MADVPVEAIRQSNRYELNINRKKLKHEENDVRRSLADLHLEPVDVSALANKLKSKASVTVKDLQLLKNTLIQDEQNIELVLNTQGALKGLVREISGLDVNRQVEAAGCLCNLALGDERACLAVTRAAGAYLIAALDSQNSQLAITCAWTLGNLCGGGAGAARLLARCGAAARLCALLTRGGSSPLGEAAVEALTLYAHAMGDQLSKEHLELMVESVGGASCRRDLRLCFLLSCHRHYRDPARLLQHRLARRLPALMRRHHTACVERACCDVQLAVRALANTPPGAGVSCGVQRLLRDAAARRDLLQLAEDPRLKGSVLWLLGNSRQLADHSTLEPTT